MNTFPVRCLECGVTDFYATKTEINRTSPPMFQFFCASCKLPSAVDEVVWDSVVQQHYVDLYRQTYNPNITDEELKNKIVEAANLQVSIALKPYHNH